MNDETLTRLKIIVEKTVRPVRASRLRKRRMREELLAHLAASLEEEMQTQGPADQQTAIARVEQRFGDPTELAPQLQESIPRRDWLTRFREEQEFRPDNSLLSRAIWFVLAYFVGCVAVMALIGLPLMASRGRLSEFTFGSYILFVMFVFMTGLWLLFVLFSDRMYRALYDRRSERSLPRARLYGLLSVPVFPIFILAFYWVLTGDVALGYARVCLVCLSGLLTPALLVVAARQLAHEMQLDQEWTDLKIEE